MDIEELRTIKALSKLRNFIYAEKKRAEDQNLIDAWTRDLNRIDLAFNKLNESEEDGLNFLREEIRGFTHYLGGYVKAKNTLDKLTNVLYEKVMLDIIDRRNKR
jgi:hypothetical protein